MFPKKTLFILGSGASLPYGYPIGVNLVSEIIKNIDSDQIYFPVDYRQTQNGRRNFSLESYTSLTKQYPIITTINDNISVNNHLTKKIIQVDNRGFYFEEIKLSEIDDLARLRDALDQFSPTSIDIFLRDNPSYAKAGKLMIIYSLLKLENLFDFNHSANGKSNDMDDNWYPFLLNDILYGCADNPENIKNMNVNFLTFNYDGSLDYFIISRLSKIEILKNAFPDLSYLNNVNIHHIYGSIHGDNPIVYGEYFHKNKVKNTALLNAKRFDKSLNCIDNIKTIFDERKERDIAAKYIQEAEEIIIIGFGFDRTNLDVLGFPNSVNSNKNFQEFLSGKTVRYMNYNGEMTNIDNEFEIISSHCVSNNRGQFAKITRSCATKIKNAYFRDFKPSLLTD